MSPGPAPWHAADAPQAVAARWARALGLPVRITPLGAGALGAPPQATWHLSAHFAGPAGEARLTATAALCAGPLRTLAGLPGRTSGPVAPTDAECGLFAYLALEAAAALPDWEGALTGVACRASALDARATLWWVRIDGVAGLLAWSVPSPPVSARHVPVPTRLTAPCTLPAGALRSAWAWPHPPHRWCWTAAGHVLGDCRIGWTPSGPNITLAPENGCQTPLEAPLPLDAETLPCALTLDLGTLVLPAGAIAALAPGDALPLALPDPIPVWIRAGDVLVAEAELHAVDGQTVLRIRRSLLPAELR